MKEKPALNWAKEHNKKHMILGLMEEEGGRRSLRAKCIFDNHGKVSFSPMIKVTKEWEQWFIDKYNIQLCKLYYPPYNFKRTGCKGCPFARGVELRSQLATMEELLKGERRQCEYIWQPVYREYRRIGYRLKDEYIEQISFDL